MRETGNEVALKQKQKKLCPNKKKALPYSIYELPMYDLSTAINGWPHDLAKGSRESRPVLPAHLCFFVLTEKW